ncbi:unnamed protein product, partial [Phaeothamnion confervicola]
AATCDGRAQSRPRPVVIEAVGHVDYGVQVDLRAEMHIGDECEMNLPIEVPPLGLAIDTMAPAAVVTVSALNDDGTYGVGDRIYVTVQFSEAVYVVGSPSLSLRTGCHQDDCRTVETQEIYCKATRGELAISFNGETMPNVLAGASQEALQRVLEDFAGVDAVSVRYNNSEGLRRLCTDGGNTARISFQAVASSLGDDGNLPPLQLDYLNAPVNAKTGESWGSGERLWFGWLNGLESEPTWARQDLAAGGANLDVEGKECLGKLGLSGVELSAVAAEVVSGSWPQDRLAAYLNGSGTDTLTFVYEVQSGDAAEDLEFAGADALSAANTTHATARRTAIVGANGVPANTTLPLPGFAPVYRLGTGSSLAANRNLKVTTAAPAVAAVTSPDDDRAYGTGEVILIDVTFDQPVTVKGAPLLRLETGVSDAFAAFLEASASDTLRFYYEVQKGDSTADLDYLAANALDLNGGAILRTPAATAAVATATVAARLTLPTPGSAGSLSASKNIVVR